MTIMPDRDWLELQQQRENERRAARSRFQRIRDWFFTPRGALVYFGIGYAALACWLIWRWTCHWIAASTSKCATPLEAIADLLDQVQE